MLQVQSCQRCGTALSKRAPEGLCPRCLLESAVRLAVSDDFESTITALPENTSGLFPTAPPAVPRLGNYELLEPIASGGMGMVYKARQLGLNRLVAVKVLPYGPFTREEFLRRFELEASAAAKLRHPNIVTIFEVGSSDGCPFFSMEYVDGPTLADLVRSQPLPVTRAVRFVRTIAEAVHYAHERGILHRDLKPSNVLIDALDQPRVTDFGLARDLADPSDLTLSGQAIGSPNFMPPEQAEGRHAQIDRRSDVYALGAVLYYLLTGRPPFTADSAMATLRQVAQNDPVAPRLLNPNLSRDLETICLRCLEKEPARRYASAQEFADELGRLQRGEPILTRPVTLAERAWSWCRRRPVVAGLWAMLVMVTVAGFAATLGQWRRAERTAGRLAALVTRLELDGAEDRLQRGDTAEALASLANVLRREPGNYIAAMRIFSVLSQRNFIVPEPLVIQDDHVGRNSAFAQQGHWLVTATNEARILQLWDTRKKASLTKVNRSEAAGSLLTPSLSASGGESVPDGQARSYSALSTNASESGVLKLVHRMPCPEPVRVTSFRQDGAQLVAATARGRILVFNVLDGSRVAGPHSTGAYLDRVLLSPDGRQVLAHTSGPSHDDWRRAKLLVLDSVTGRVLREESRTHWAAFSPDGLRLVTIEGSSARLRDAATWEPLGKPLRHGARINTAEFSLDSRLVVTASADRTSRLWNVETGEEAGAPLRHRAQVLSAMFSPDSKRIVTVDIASEGQIWDSGTGSRVGARFKLMKGFGLDSFMPGGSIFVAHYQDKLWLRDTATGEQRAEILDIGQRVTRARFLSDGQRLLTSTFGGRAQIWDVAPGGARERRLPHKAEVNTLSFSADGSLVVTAARENSSRVWNARTGAPVCSSFAHEHEGQVRHAAFSPDGRRVVTASYDRTARVWELPDGKQAGPALQHQRTLEHATFSPDGLWLITASEDGTARLWHAETLEPAAEPLRHRGGVLHATFSPDARLLATVGKDNAARLWRVPTGTPAAAPLLHVNSVNFASFSPDGRRLATCSEDRTARIWEVISARSLTPPLRHESKVNTVHFDSRGHSVVTASDDGTAQIWNAFTGAARTRRLRHGDAVVWAEFSPDGRFVATASRDHTARIWDAAAGDPVTDPLRHDGVVTTVRWNPNGASVATASYDRTARIWPVDFLSDAAPPQWLPALAEAIGGRRLSGDGIFEHVEPSEYSRLKRQFLESATPRIHRAWLEWFFTTRSENQMASQQLPK